jgi:uridine phosphorylase
MHLLKTALFFAFVFTSSLMIAEIRLTPADCLFVRCQVPDRGIVTSNVDRAKRLSKKLKNRQTYTSSWGSFVVVGEYNGRKMFVGCAPVGAGSGLVFTELCVQGAKYIVRYGSDDVKSPPKSDNFLVKIVDEADGLYGFNHQSGVDPQEWGKSVAASQKLVTALETTATKKKIAYEKRICHHLENYHALRCPDKYAPENSERLQSILEKHKANTKPCSYDMETAVLFRVAKDFGIHAATVLQTFDKDRKKVNTKEIIKVEEEFFFSYVLDAVSGVES